MRTKRIIFILIAGMLSSGIFSQPDTTKKRPIPYGHRPIPGRRDTAGHSKSPSTKKDTVAFR